MKGTLKHWRSNVTIFISRGGSERHQVQDFKEYSLLLAFITSQPHSKGKQSHRLVEHCPLKALLWELLPKGVMSTLTCVYTPDLWELLPPQLLQLSHKGQRKYLVLGRVVRSQLSDLGHLTSQVIWGQFQEAGEWAAGASHKSERQDLDFQGRASESHPLSHQWPVGMGRAGNVPKAQLHSTRAILLLLELPEEFCLRSFQFNHMPQSINSYWLKHCVDRERPLSGSARKNSVIG